jgi:Raf kinase inhibitor-like YbhB/YbcL family protein
MRRRTLTPLVALALLLPLAGLRAQQVSPPPPPANPTAAQRGGEPPAQPQPGRGGGRGGRGVQVMTLSTTAWTDGGQIPVKYSQAGDELSPPLTWSGAPEGTASFVLIVHDLDAMTNPPNDYTAPVRDTNDVLHWLVWNIPATATGLPEGVPQGPQLPEGTRQISQTGPYYRGPAAPATGPAHHYVFELYALDTTISIPNTDTSAGEVRAAVKAAMATHIRGKAALVGLYKR